MERFRPSRPFVRLLAAWLLLSFVLMAASAYRGATVAPVAGEEGAPAGSIAHEAHAGHDGHHGQHARPGPEEGDENAAAPSEQPRDHHANHCPLCLHAAAPPASVPPGGLPSLPPTSPQAGFVTAHVPRQTATPPPARGPPSFS